jgi:hypothetical protein
MVHVFNLQKHHDLERIKPHNVEVSIDYACTMVGNMDIVLFSGESEMSFLVMLFCGSQWSHVGIVYREPGKEPMLFESIKTDDKGSDNIDVITRKVETGVRLVSLRHTLETFKGHAVAIRTFSMAMAFMYNPDLEQLYYKHMFDTMKKCIKRYHRLGYELRIYNFIFARFNFITIKEETLDALFCSELVALCLMKAGLLPRTHSSIQFLPDDFCTEGTYKPSCPREFSVNSVASSLKVKLSRTHYVRTKLIYESTEEDSLIGGPYTDTDEESTIKFDED